MLKTIAIIFGVIVLAIGILGFIPQANPGDLLLGLFHVNLIHNLIHIATGIVSILCGLSSNYASQVFFQVFGIVYGLVALLGFYYMDQNILGLIANNMADNLLHVLISAVSLYLGFFYPYPDITDSNIHHRNLK
jgi:hypothetical protein